MDQFQANIDLLGDADFVSHFVETRVNTSPSMRFLTR